MEITYDADHNQRKILTKSFFICFASMLLAQGAVDTSLNIGQLLKDRYYQYESIFLPFSTALLAAYLYHSLKKNLRVPIFLTLGLVFGYVASFVAFYALPLFAIHGWERFWQPPRTSEDWIALGWSPLIILSWAVGGLASVLVVFLAKISSPRVLQLCLAIAIVGALLLTRRFSLLGHIISAAR